MMMKDVFFERLKTDLQKLGLPENVLQAYAEANGGAVNEENIEGHVRSAEIVLKAVQSNLDRLRSEKVEALKQVDALKNNRSAQAQETPPNDSGDNSVYAEKFSKLEQLVSNMDATIKSFEAKERAQTRQAFIQSTAKSLGIPEWRLSEGFIFEDNSDESAIKAALTAVKQNLVVAGLAQDKGAQSAGKEAPKLSDEELDKMLKN